MIVFVMSFFSLKNFLGMLFSQKSGGATRIINHGWGLGVRWVGVQEVVYTHVARMSADVCPHVYALYASMYTIV